MSVPPSRAWANDPSSENAGTVRVESRRAYGSQSARRTGRNWLARRGIIAAAKIASGPPYDTKGILESLSWHRSTRQAHYASLFSLRSELGSLHADAEKKILAEMDEKFANLQELGQDHLPALLDCLAVYEHALIEEGATAPGQRELRLGAVAGVLC